MEYSMPKSVTMNQIKLRINDIYSMAVSCRMDHNAICDMLKERVILPLNERNKSNRRKHSQFMYGYAQGIIDAWRDKIWRDHVEFCYEVDGILYSTHKTSKRSTTAQFYDAGQGSILADAKGAHYWRDNEHGDKIY